MKLLLIAHAVTAIAAVSISNSELKIDLDPSAGIQRITELTGAAPLIVKAANDGWAITIVPKSTAMYSNSTKLVLSSTSSNCTAAGAAVPSDSSSPSSSKNVTLHWMCKGPAMPGGSSGFPLSYRVEVSYALRDDSVKFVEKVLRVASSRPESVAEGSFVVDTVTPYDGITLELGGAAPSAMTFQKFLNNRPRGSATLEIAGFARWGATGRGAFLTIANPWGVYSDSAAPNPPASYCPGDDIGSNHPGDDLAGPGGVPAASVQACAALCDAKAGCVGIAFLPAGCNKEPVSTCYLKSNSTNICVHGGSNCAKCTCGVSKPWPTWPPTPPVPSPAGGGAGLWATYGANFVQTSDSAELYYDSEPALFGLTHVSKYYNEYGLTMTERLAFVRCVESYLLDHASRANKTVKVNVAWDENDYQIDVGTDAGRTEYKRIIDRNAEFGVTHIVYEPRNTLVSSRFNTTDGWGWEGSLWLSMGEQLREGSWDPRTDPFIPEIQEMIDYAHTKGVSLMGYVYPCLLFQSQPQAWDGGAMDLSNNAAANWLLSVMLAFLEKSGGGGFAWDHNIYAGSVTKQYSQWRSWMRILATLREFYPEMVMDHRQTAHEWGPWYQLAGSYDEPIAGDENPESYGVPIASLHTDHVAGDHTRIINHQYSLGQMIPPARVPGFIFHQTERTADNGTDPCFSHSKLCYDSNVRDFDLLGYKYSMLSTVATAGQNLVFTMIPARDVEEFTKFPKDDIAWIRKWVDWTDANLPSLRNTVPIPTLPSPMLGAVDGTVAFDDNDETGFVFLFNPGFTPLNASLVVDEGLAISNTSASDAWDVVQLYPEPTAAGEGEAATMMWTHGQRVDVAVGGSSARVLQLTKKKKKMAATTTTMQAADFLPLAPRGEVYRAMPISSDVVPKSFAGGVWKTSFSIPAAINAQLKARAAAYPIDWNEQDRIAAWLDQTRLLGYIFIGVPQDKWEVTLAIDGKAVPLIKAYNSRGVVHSGCFLGYYFDATKMALNTQAHTLEVTIPTAAAKDGAFEGIFWQNVV